MPVSWLTRAPEITHNALRIVAGFLWMPHGAQKLFASFGREEAAQAFTQIWLAGVIEFAGGLLLMVGLFTRPVAFIAAGEMAVAYFQAHLPRGFWPILNGGELAALYCFLWLYFAAAGAGRFSLDGLLGRRRTA